MTHFVPGLWSYRDLDIELASMRSHCVQDCRRSRAALTRKKRGTDKQNESALTKSDDKPQTKTFRDANATLTVWYPNELLDHGHRPG